MFEKLEEVVQRFEALEAQLSDPIVLANHITYTRLSQEHGELAAVVEAYQRHRQLSGEKEEARKMLGDEDPAVRDLAREEIDALDAEHADVEQRLKQLLIPKDPLDAKDIVLEVRAGTGGDEASLFAGDLFEVYCRYAASKKWKLELISSSQGTVGGYKEVIALIQGQNVYRDLRFEAGVHRVQRIPSTERQGRIHTSACTVAILPEAEEIDVELDPNDLNIDTYRASGAGGQHVNTTDSAIRITHVPSGLVVTSQDERSQHKNKARALKVLRSRLLDLRQQQSHQARASARRNMVGSGDRSERIRTYNFPQNRITDHRIGLTLYNLDRVMATGELTEIIEALRTRHQAERLSEGSS